MRLSRRAIRKAPNMRSNDHEQTQEILRWCESALGPSEVVSDHSRVHAGNRVSVHRLRAPSGYCYVKTYRNQSQWENEVHGYEQWAPAFGDSAPRLLAVRDQEPLALVIGELPGKVLEDVQLSVSQEHAVWRAAGRALVKLHDLAVGEYFGPCRRDGSCAGTPIYDATAHVVANLEDRVERGTRAGYLTSDEQAIVRRVRGLIAAFEGERPIPCHRDYCPANWLVAGDGAWTGVIDFEFASWDVRVSDFTRYPGWDWMGRPDKVDAFFDGYGRPFTSDEEQQRLVAYAQYAVDAIVWGIDNSYHGFAEEGRRALERLGELL